jgi:hypothetical protein
MPMVDLEAIFERLSGFPIRSFEEGELVLPEGSTKHRLLFLIEDATPPRTAGTSPGSGSGRSNRPIADVAGLNQKGIYLDAYRLMSYHSPRREAGPKVRGITGHDHTGRRRSLGPSRPGSEASAALSWTDTPVGKAAQRCFGARRK